MIFSERPEKKKLSGIVFLAIVVPGLALIGYASTEIFQPQRLANEIACIGPSDSDPAYQNLCGYDVNFQYCFYSKRGAEYDMCRNTRLAPSEGVTTIAQDLTDLGGLHNAGLYACKAPFVPGRYDHPNTHRMTAACVKVGDPHAGPHMVRTRVYVPPALPDDLDPPG